LPEFVMRQHALSLEVSVHMASAQAVGLASKSTLAQVPLELQKDTQQQVKEFQEALAKLQELYMGQTAAEEADAAEAAAAGAGTAGRARTSAAANSSAGAS
jgi:predicted translin family RNA/ssDNA-binding protein